LQGSLNQNTSCPEFHVISGNRGNPERACVLAVTTTFLTKHLFQGMVPLKPSDRTTFVNTMHCLSPQTGQPNPRLTRAAALSGLACNCKLSCAREWQGSRQCQGCGICLYYETDSKFSGTVLTQACQHSVKQFPGNIQDLAQDRDPSQ